ncbi:MAG: ADP-ribosylglycohydrolase family protein [Spirochaetales bacterium]|nr:ADP-ribosylglycohydrolase family protein [Spirochaetales bacterium]
MLGAVIGDIAGSTFEGRAEKPDHVGFFEKGSLATDDTVCTLAVANAILEWTARGDRMHSRRYYAANLRAFGTRYPDVGYGQSFREWIFSDDPRPYRSYGNGAAMRVSPIGLACGDMAGTLREAVKCAGVTHNHPDGVKGAKAAAGAVFLAHRGFSKTEIKRFIEGSIGYPLDFDIEDLHRNYRFEIKCSRSVPQAIFAFLVSEDFEDAVRKALYLGGDSDTIASITGAIAAAYYKKIPERIKNGVLPYLDAGQKKIIREFDAKFGITY